MKVCGYQNPKESTRIRGVDRPLGDGKENVKSITDLFEKKA